ncbi:hypothetical protein ACS0TY_002127 [Phlomoides rotata]
MASAASLKSFPECFSSCPCLSMSSTSSLIIKGNAVSNFQKNELINYFTFKAVRTVLEQLYEMNPPQYKWFNNFCAENVPNNAKRFLQTLVKKCDHGEIYNEISDENLKLMRERLLETIQWPLDDTTKPDQTD